MPLFFKSLLIGIMFFSATACGSQSPKSPVERTDSEEQTTPIAQNIDVSTFSRYMQEKQDRQLLDVRTPGETADGIIPGALTLDISDPSFKTKIAMLNKEKPVLVYCRTGARSGQVMRQMQQMGFKEVYNLSGGIYAWQSQGQTLIRK